MMEEKFNIDDNEIEFINSPFFYLLCKKIKTTPFLRSFFFVCFLNLVFFIGYFLSDWKNIIPGSFLLIQLNFSITIFIGIFFGNNLFDELTYWMQLISYKFGIGPEDRMKFIKNQDELLSSFLHLIPAIIFIIACGMAINQIAQLIPNSIFPFSEVSFVFIWVFGVELCIIMMYLFGGTAIWFTIWFINTTEKVRRIKTLDYFEIDKYSINNLFAPLLKWITYYFIIVSSVMPSIIFIVSKFSHKYIDFVFYVFVLAIPLVSLVIGFGFPLFHFHKLMEKAKEIKIMKLKTLKGVCEEVLEGIVYNSKTNHEKMFDETTEKQLDLLRYYNQEIKIIEESPNWPINLSSFFQAIFSSLLPIIISLIANFEYVFEALKLGQMP